MHKFSAFLTTLMLLSGCGGSGGSDGGAAQSSASTSSSVSSSTSSSLSSASSTNASSSSATSLPGSASSSSSVDTLAQGRILFESHCAECHGEDASGEVGPSLLFTLYASDILESIETQGDMQHLANIIEEEEAELIADYVNWLKENPSSSSSSSVSIEAEKVTLGRELFFDENLSLRKTMSCSTCHNSNHGFVDARYLDANTTNPVHGALSVGDDGVTLGGRNAPTAGYAQFTPDFTQQQDGSYIGGLFHDGRAATLKTQAKGPFLDPAEMMMPDAAAVVERVLDNADYVTRFKAIYGENVFDDTDIAYDALAESIATFESTKAFAPFDSKYDRSKLDSADEDYYAMTASEQLGYALFFDHNRTGCALCHSLNSDSEAAKEELFTNYGYRNIGAPRNLAALLARDGSTDARDAGLGGRADINDTALYGMIKVPSLRNVAVTGPYMHTGVFNELRTVIAFYEHMSGHGDEPLNPETNAAWKAPDYNATINRASLEKLTTLGDEEVDALIAFLKLLTDQRYEDLLEE